MDMLVGLIIFFATIENMYPLIVGYLKTPPGYVYLGTVHHPGDYFYYVSQFWRLGDLYTSEKLPFTIIGWPNFLMGKLIPLFPLYSYQLWVLILTIVLFICAYKVSFLHLGNKKAATICVYLFALYHAFPLFRQGLPSYGDYWNNFAVPRVRFGAVPHQLLIGIASMLLVSSVLKKQKLYISIWSIVLASLQPVVWALIVTSLLSPFATAVGLPMIFYLHNIFQMLPYSQLKAWEAAQHTKFTLFHFISSTGPIFLIALFPLKHQRFPLFFSFLSFALFLSPIPQLLGVSHVRFLSTLVILCLCILATNTIMRIKFWPAILIALSIVLLPNHVKTLEIATRFDTNNAYYYVPSHIYNKIVAVRKTSKPDDVFIVPSPYNTIFPALTGRTSYNGHPLLTIQPEHTPANAIYYEP